MVFTRSTNQCFLNKHPWIWLFVCLFSLEMYQPANAVRFSTGSHTVRTAWPFEQYHTKESHCGLNTNILVMSLFHYYFYIILIDPDCILPLFFILYRGRSSPLDICCHFLLTGVYWPGHHSSYLLQEVCGRFSSSPFAIHTCLMCGNFFLQEKGSNISKNTRTKGPPQQYSRQQLQGTFFKNLIFLDLHELMWDIFNLGKQNRKKKVRSYVYQTPFIK